MAKGYGQLQAVQTQVHTNSAGHWIIRDDGIEYSRCQ